MVCPPSPGNWFLHGLVRVGQNATTFKLRTLHLQWSVLRLLSASASSNASVEAALPGKLIASDDSTTGASDSLIYLQVVRNTFRSALSYVLQ